METVMVAVPIKDSREMTSRFVEAINKQDTPARILFIEGGTIGAARQRALEESTTEYIAFLDSDCIPVRNTWISELLAQATIPDVGMVWSPGEIPPDSPWINRYALHSHTLPDPPETITRDNYVPVGTGSCIVRKSVVTWIGGFKNVMAGYAIKFVKSPVYHYHVRTLIQYFRKYVRNIRNAKDLETWKEEYIEKPESFINQILGAPLAAAKGYKATRDPAWLMHPVIMAFKGPLALAALA